MTASERVYRSLLDVFERLFGAVDSAWFERRPGHVVMSYPPAPLLSFHGVWENDDAADGRPRERAQRGSRPRRMRTRSASPGVVRCMYDRATIDRYGGRVYVRRENGRAVSTALAVPTDEGVGIFNVATPKAERGRGFGAAVTLGAVGAQFKRGRSFAFLQTSRLGESVYQRLGFRRVGSYTLAFAPPH